MTSLLILAVLNLLFMVTLLVKVAQVLEATNQLLHEYDVRIAEYETDAFDDA